MWESHDPLLEFWDHLNILGMTGARNFKFGTDMDDLGTKEKIQN